MSSKAARRSAAERAAEVRRAQHAAERRRNLYVVAAVTAVLAVIVGVGLLVQSNRDTTGEDAVAPGVGSSSSGAPTDGSAADARITDDYGVVVGDLDAPTTITVYEDFQCPVCRAFEEATSDQVRKAVEAGDVKVEYRVVSFLDRASENAYSSRAANAAMVVLDTAGVEAFWTFHDRLFADQPEEGTAGPTDDELVDLAVSLAADRAAVEAGVDGGDFDKWVKNATDAMSRHGVTGTPTALIDGEVAGQTPQETIEAVLAAVS